MLFKFVGNVIQIFTGKVLDIESNLSVSPNLARMRVVRES
jgi:hypothetical protein